MTDHELVTRARGGDAEARRVLVERSSLRVARMILGDSAKDRADALRELTRGAGPAPGLGVLLEGIALADGAAALHAALQLAHRNVGRDRWNAPERAAIGATVARHGEDLDAELALDLLEWSGQLPDDTTSFVTGAAAALGHVRDDAFETLAWRRGLELLVLHDRALAVRWSGAPGSAKALARAVFAAHEHAPAAAIATLQEIWQGTSARAVWAEALAHATSQNSVHRREDIAGWAWERFVAHPDERRDLYRAFVRWREHWMELRNAMPGDRRPGGVSAIAHLELWAGLEIERLTATVDEAVRLLRGAEWAALVDATFTLAEAAPQPARLHALAGACRIGHEVSNRVRNDEVMPGLDEGADRFIARAETLCARLVREGAQLDAIVANRIEDLETDVRLIRERRERDAERARDAAERDAQRARQAEEQRRMREDVERQVAEAHRQADEARRRAAEMAAEMQRQMQEQMQRAVIGPHAKPNVEREPLDDEPFFSALPVPTLLSYARMVKRMTTDPQAMQALAAEGITMASLGVINQTWTTLFGSRPDLALRFATLISVAWS